MGWAVGYDPNWKRDIGYGVPAKCDHPDCPERIDRGLAYVCGDEPYGGEHGCGLFFCSGHLSFKVDELGRIAGPQQCEKCAAGEEPFTAKPDVPEWINHKLADPSWQQWRDEYPEEVEKMRAAVGQ
ncbi:hypothetical protein [Mycolicibacterium llatzerense]|uniref:hypothetical protein n=1 Tax=Mycolicibacterium llatzerense TaxID=280871 RepID=UPI0021B56B79|nr:hypothetical protein [Mycolicibacterium llatzerense]MCT7369433.1 hypothetical protein [Mycolicibacterium llatzerense]